MNYYEARERKSGDERTGCWDWTCMNDGRVFPVPPCSEHEDGHRTKEEAERHFYDHELSHLKEVEIAEQQRKCEHRFPHEARCGNWTSKGMESRYLGTVMLCDEHRNSAGFSVVHPFTPNMRIVASW